VIRFGVPSSPLKGCLSFFQEVALVFPKTVQRPTLLQATLRSSSFLKPTFVGGAVFTLLSNIKAALDPQKDSISFFDQQFVPSPQIRLPKTPLTNVQPVLGAL